MKFFSKFIFMLLVVICFSVSEANAYGSRYGYYNSRYDYNYGSYGNKTSDSGRQKVLSPYVGLDFVSAQFAEDENSTAFLNKDNSGVSVKLGMKFSNYFGVELFYTKTDEETVDTGITGVLTYDIEGYGADINITLPVGSFDLIGIAGAGYYDIVHESVSGTFKASDPFEDILGYRFGGGVQYNINEHFGLRASYVKVSFDHENIDEMDELSAGVRLTF